VITAALVVLVIAACGFTLRVVLGPSLPDRIVALDGLLTCTVLAIIAGAIRTGSTGAIDTVLVVTLVGFVGTSVAARFVERRGG